MSNDDQPKVSATGTIVLEIVNVAPRDPNLILRTASEGPRPQEGSTLMLRRGGGTTERISGPRPSAPWGYVVRNTVGCALEVLVERRTPRMTRFASHHPEQLATETFLLGPDAIEVKDAVLHQRIVGTVTPEQVEDGVEPMCALVGGACHVEGVVTSVEKRFDLHGRKVGPGWDQPEPFWLSLEQLLTALIAYEQVELDPERSLVVPSAMTDEQRARVEALANWAAEEGDPDVLTMATAVLDGELAMLVDVLAVHGVWAKRYEGKGR